MKQQCRTRERGATLVLVALMLVVFIALAAIAIDVGVIYTARTSAQHAADAASLAGAFEFVNPCFNTPAPAGCGSWDIQAAAKQSAIRIAAQNQILHEPVTITEADVTVDETNRRVTVTVPRTGAEGIGTFFARAFGSNSVDVIARATAEAGVSGTANNAPTATTSQCLKPLFIPNTILSKQPTVADACNAGEVIFSASGSVSTWASANADSIWGQPYMLKPSKPQNSLAPSQFYALDFAPCTVNGDTVGGADCYRCTLGNCLNQCGIENPISCGEGGTTLDVETGNMAGPTYQGINTMIGTPDGSNPAGNIDRYSAIDQYLIASDFHTSSTSKNLAVAAVWNNCPSMGGRDIGPGTTQNVPVLGFIQVFIDKTLQPGEPTNSSQHVGDTTAHPIRPLTCGEASGGGGADDTTTGPTTGPFAVPIRLVQNPSQ